MTGLPLIFVFVLAIVLMIVLISKWNVHPFVAQCHLVRLQVY